jgi:uncharacterized membrane protein
MNDLTKTKCKTVPPWLMLCAIAAVLTNVVLLSWLAASTSIWDDEIAGFYAVRLPALEMLRAMRACKLHFDPPLFYLLLGLWQLIAGYSPFLLRLLPITFWILALVGMYLVGKRLGGKTAGFWVIIAASLIPYHWLFPMSLRWYSLAACLAVWNLYFFLIISDKVNSTYQPKHETNPSSTGRLFLVPLMGYAFTGAALWYTTFTAPVYFFGHFVIVLVGAKRRLSLFYNLITGWILIVLLYLPWLPTFLHLLDTNIAREAPRVIRSLLSIYVMFASDFSTPFNWWISIPLALVILSLAGLSLRFLSYTFVPLLVSLTMLFALLITKNLNPKYMLLVSPFAAMTIGLTWKAASQKRKVWTTRALRTILCLTAIVLVGSSMQMFSRTGWASYRWLDPIESAVKEAEHIWPKSVFLTNSQSVAFYRKETFEFKLFGTCLSPTILMTETPRVFRIDREGPSFYSKMIDEVLSLEQRVIYIHHTSFRDSKYTDRDMRGVLQMLIERGYREIKRKPALKISPVFHRFIPNLPSHRVITFYFSKENMHRSGQVE